MARTRYSVKTGDGAASELVVEEAEGRRLYHDEDGAHEVQLHPSRRSIRSATIDNRQVEFGVVLRDGAYHIVIDGVDYTVRVVDARFEKLLALGQGKGRAQHGRAQVRAPIPGLVVRLLVETGQQVERDQPLLILDAMKLENEILAPGDGTVGAIKVVEGQAVEKDELLLEVS